jgi:uncharacterized protein YndB with AHSA1/START domain
MSDVGGDAANLLPPVERRLLLRCRRAQAWTAWLERIGRWWPEGFSASGPRLAAVVIEERPGGRVFERDGDGKEFDWGTVRACERERRLVLEWTLAVETPTEVELLFADTAVGCELRFAHRGFRVGQEAVRAKFDAERGWNVGLAAFQQAAERG